MGRQCGGREKGSWLYRLGRARLAGQALLLAVLLVGTACGSGVAARFAPFERDSGTRATEAGQSEPSVVPPSPTVSVRAAPSLTPTPARVALSSSGQVNAILVDAATPTAAPSPAASPAPAEPIAGLEEGRLVDIGGRRLYLRCLGQGTPTVVFDAGLSSPGASSGAWDPVLGEVAKSARACTYDRANLGKSDQGKRPRTSRDNVEDLHSLLRAAGIPAPYVLVGHSFGGFQARLFAYLYPREVAGLVLVDAVHEDWYLQPEAVLTPEQVREFWVGRANNSAGADLKASALEVRNATRPLDIPLIVVTRGRTIQWPPTFPAERMERVWQDQQADLVRRSSRGRQVIATRSGHSVQQDEPALVVASIRQVLDEARAR